MAIRKLTSVRSVTWLALGMASLSLATSMAHASVANTIYTCNFAGASTLYRVNASTGAATSVGPMSIQCTYMAFRGHQLYATTVTSLYRIGPDTGSSVSIGNIGATDINALGVNPLTGKIYGAGAGSGAFYELDPATGAASIIGSYGAGLTFAQPRRIGKLR